MTAFAYGQNSGATKTIVAPLSFYFRIYLKMLFFVGNKLFEDNIVCHVAEFFHFLVASYSPGENGKFRSRNVSVRQIFDTV